MGKCIDWRINQNEYFPELYMENENFMAIWNGHKESIQMMKCKWMKHTWMAADRWMPMDAYKWIRWGQI